MKRILLTTSVFLLIVAIGYTQTKKHTETITKEIKFEKSSADNVFYLANIYGNIEVEGYSGSTIQIEVNKTITANTENILQQGIEEITLDVMEIDDTLIVYTKGNCVEFSNSEKNKWKNRGSSWGYNCKCSSCDNWYDFKQNYDYILDYNVKVPWNTNLYVSTMYEGVVKIKGVSGNLSIHNFNGNILLDDISAKTFVYNVSGDITINFKNNPTLDSRFYTLSGDIEANFQPYLSADISFKSFSGEFHTNINDLEHVATVAERTSTSKGKGIKYKLNGKAVMRTKSGGVNLDFETFNGDVFVKEIDE
ncbi:MAG: hypothetical protein OEW67_12810 [Cyclobacteriaceae bacterium]|nr:hypothetical protein [Cyclobacteriaceae bacterium]